MVFPEDNDTSPEMLGMSSKYGLNNEDVTSKNFGKHTLKGIDELIKQGRAQNTREAFEMLYELNETQVNGVVNFGLSHEKVREPSFSLDTLVRLFRKDRKRKRGFSKIDDSEDKDNTEIKSIIGKLPMDTIKESDEPKDKTKDQKLEAFTWPKYPETGFVKNNTAFSDQKKTADVNPKNRKPKKRLKNGL